jgi:release factor glutamine methyltransferase
MFTLARCLSEGRSLLKGKVEYPARDAVVLLAHILKIKSEEVYLYPERQVTCEQYREYMRVMDKRARGEPVAYLRGYKEFMGFKFSVNSRVLIPRPETELLVEEAIKLLDGCQENTLVLDMCCGSGVIGLTILLKNPGVTCLLTDLSGEALEVAKSNARELGVEHRARFFQGNMFHALAGLDICEKVDMVLSNPPYVADEDIDSLPAEVRDFEPLEALKGGPGGAILIEQLIKSSYEYLRPGGHLLFEMGEGYYPLCKRILDSNPGWTDYKCVKDYAGKDRIVICTKKLAGVFELENRNRESGSV